MTVPVLPRSDAAPRRPRLDRAGALRLATAEHERCAELLDRLEPGQWSAPTANTGWDVRATAGHMLGMVQMMASFAQLANDPGGTRWSGLLDRAIDMFADNVGITSERSRP